MKPKPQFYENDEQKQKHKQYTFSNFCKKILTRDHYGKMKRLRERDKNFSDLSLGELEQLYTLDDYYSTVHILMCRILML